LKLLVVTRTESFYTYICYPYSII